MYKLALLGSIILISCKTSLPGNYIRIYKPSINVPSISIEVLTINQDQTFIIRKFNTVSDSLKIINGKLNKKAFRLEMIAENETQQFCIKQKRKKLYFISCKDSKLFYSYPFKKIKRHN